MIRLKDNSSSDKKYTLVKLQKSRATLKYWKNYSQPFVFVVPGAIYVEKYMRSSLKWRKIIDKKAVTADEKFWQRWNICYRAVQSGYSPATIDFLKKILSSNFQVMDYVKAVDEALDELFKLRNVEAVFAQSLGTVAVLYALAQRIKDGKKVPRLLILVDCIANGLSLPARNFLRLSGQLKKPLPAVCDLLPRSVFLRSLWSVLNQVQDKFPKVIVFAGDVGQNFFAVPFGASANKKILQIAKRVNFSQKGGDGAVDPFGARLLVEKKDGELTALLPKARVVKILGAAHSQTVEWVLPYIEELLKKDKIHGTCFDRLGDAYHPSLINMSHNLVSSPILDFALILAMRYLLIRQSVSNLGQIISQQFLNS